MQHATIHKINLKGKIPHDYFQFPLSWHKSPNLARQIKETWDVSKFSKELNIQTVFYKPESLPLQTQNKSISLHPFLD